MLSKFKIFNKSSSNHKNFLQICFLNIYSYTEEISDNTFCVFSSINKILYLVYATKVKSIILYNLVNNEIISKIKQAHSEYISNFRHYRDIKNKRDLIISISGKNNNIKVWDIRDLTCLANIENIYQNGYLYSACFINDNNNIIIAASNENYELVKIYNLKGNQIETLNNSNYVTYFIDNFYDKESNINFIITGNLGFCRSYMYEMNEEYGIYKDKEKNAPHCSIIIVKDSKEITKMIESSQNGIIRIWNFHSMELLVIIDLNTRYEIKKIFGICLWDENNLCVGCGDDTIKLLNLNSKIFTIFDNLIGHNNNVLSIKKIMHPKYGNCLISQDKGNSQILLWINSKFQF